MEETSPGCWAKSKLGNGVSFMYMTWPECSSRPLSHYISLSSHSIGVDQTRDEGRQKAKRRLKLKLQLKLHSLHRRSCRLRGAGLVAVGPREIGRWVRLVVKIGRQSPQRSSLYKRRYTILRCFSRLFATSPWGDMRDFLEATSTVAH